MLLSARGRPFTHEDAVRLSLEPDLTLLCGHYKDVDQRVADHLATEEISIGDFVLSGGEMGALVVADAVVRLLPVPLGTTSRPLPTLSMMGSRLSPPSYTRPAEYRGLEVPEVLQSGDHARIQAWKGRGRRDSRANAGRPRRRTSRRGDLLRRIWVGNRPFTHGSHRFYLFQSVYLFRSIRTI